MALFLVLLYIGVLFLIAKTPILAMQAILVSVWVLMAGSVVVSFVLKLLGIL